MGGGLESEVSVMERGCEGGGWGIGGVGGYIFECDRYRLCSYLKEVGFEDSEGMRMRGSEDDIGSLGD